MTHAEKTREVIIQLKKWRVENGYSIQKIYDILMDHNVDVSQPTVRNIFAEGSEDKNFRYQDTIKPIASVLLKINAEAIQTEENSEIAALKAIILAKDEAIASEQRKVQHLIKENERKDNLLDERGDFMRELSKFMRRKDRYIAALSVVAGLFFLYLMFIDLPNPNYGFVPFFRGLFGI